MPHSFLLFMWLLTGGGVFALTRCGQDPTTGTTRVAGQVVERQGHRPVGNGTVQVWLAGNGGGYGPVGAPQPCDAQGRFSFAFDATNDTGYLLKAKAPPGYLTDWADAPELTAGRKNTGLTVSVLAPAWVRFVLVDELPKSRINIHIQGYNSSGETLQYPRDTILTRPLLANFRTGLLWVINDQGVEKASTVFVQPAPLDTVTVRIPF